MMSTKIQKKLAKHEISLSLSTVRRSRKKQGWTLQRTAYCQLFCDANPNICVVATLKAYLDRTSSLHGGAQQLFISHSKPFKPVSWDTISRWVKTVMQKSGIDVNLFKPHSTRAAATSKAFLKSAPLEHILSVAGWNSSDTFA